MTHKYSYGVSVSQKNGILGLNINSKEHKQTLLTSYTPFESPTIQLSDID